MILTFEIDVSVPRLSACIVASPSGLPKLEIRVKCKQINAPFTSKGQGRGELPSFVLDQVDMIGGGNSTAQVS